MKSIDKNKMISVLLVTTLLMIYFHYFGPKKQAQNNSTPTTQLTNGPLVANVQTPPPHTYSYGDFEKAFHGNTQEVTLENELLKIIFTNKGGKVKEVILKNYQTYDQQPLKLLQESKSDMGLHFKMKETPINTSSLYFHTQNHSQNIQGQEQGTVEYRLALNPTAYIRQIYRLRPGSYQLDYEVEIVGMEHLIDQSKVSFIWEDLVNRVEKNLKESRQKTTINYYLSEGKFNSLKERSSNQEEKQITQPIQWVGVKQKFFTAAIIAHQPFQSGQLFTTPTPQQEDTVKSAKMDLQATLSALKDGQGKFTFYFGPNDYRTLKTVAPGFSKNMKLGWPFVRWVNQYVMLPIFYFLKSHISNFGIIIIVLALIIKLLLLPLSYKSSISAAKMKILKPSLDAIKEKYKGDMQKTQMEQVNLYRNLGINPLSGCIPVLLQLPILITMFNCLPNLIDLRQQAFLWASDLSTYDSVLNLPFTIPGYGSHVSLFTALMTLSTLLYTWSSSGQLGGGNAEGPMKFLPYLMPITFMFVLNSFPSALSFYYLVSNLLTFGQQELLKRFVNEEEIKLKLEEAQKQGSSRTKSRLQTRLEKATKKKK